jgi:hypothetical protein
MIRWSQVRLPSVALAEEGVLVGPKVADFCRSGALTYGQLPLVTCWVMAGQAIVAPE